MTDYESTANIRAAIAASAATVASLDAMAERIAASAAAIGDVLAAGGKVMTAGNGGSAAEALHMAEELVGRYRAERASLAGMSLVADPTALTCIGNDYGFDHIFSRQIEGLGRHGDALVLFSTSGSSRNLVLALKAARARGITTVCVLGRDGGKLAGQGDFEIIVSGTRTERIQEAHQVFVHLVLDAIEDRFLEKT